MNWKQHGLIFLFFLTIFLRLFPIFPDRFPFMYDHAKDSLIIMQMGTKLRPSLVGAVTSIPGVYYGPAWYYLALPFNMLLDYHPLASVLTVIFLAAGGTWIAWKYLGKLEATLWAVSFGVIGSQTSAWSPYLTPLVILPILAILLNLKRGKKIAWQKLGLLSLLVSLGFHFQPAYAFLLLPIVIAILFLLKVKTNWRDVFIAIIIFLIPFTPHLIFELRHDFHQTKELIHFFTNYGEESRVVRANAMGAARLWEIADFVMSEAGNSVSPMNLPFYYWGGIVVLALIYYEAQNYRGKSKLPLTAEERIVFYSFLIGTWLLYQFLPAKQYYLVAIIPVWTVLIARLIKYFWPKKVEFIMTGVVILAIIQAFLSRQHLAKLSQEQAVFLAPKIAAIAKTYELSQGEPFAVYTSLPELYDYPYQHLYRYFMLKGYPTPVEYSYAPHEVAHMSIVAPRITQQPATELPAQQFIVIERPQYGFIFDEWRGRVVSPLTVEDEYQIIDGLRIYKTHP